MPAPYHVSIFKDLLGNECYFVIDTLFKGVSVGGVRVYSEITLQEVKDLARHMSYKLALFDLPVGGAKLGIKLKDNSMKKQTLINFKEKLKPFIKNLLYFPGKDLGTTEDDIALIYKGILRQRWKSYSSYYTAVGMSSCLDFIKKRWDFKDLDVALSGFGRVGYFLVKEFIKQGINLVAISNNYGCIYKESGLNKEELIALKEQFDEDWIFHITQDILPKEVLYTLPVDVLIPGAEAYAINIQNIDSLKTKFICPVANVPYQTETMERLKERSIIFFPDFVTNVGGVLGEHLISWGFSSEEVEREVKSRIYNMLIHLYENSQNDYFNYALKLVKGKLCLRNRLDSKYKKRSVLKKKLMVFLKMCIPKRLRKECYNLLFNRDFEVKRSFISSYIANSYKDGPETS